MKPHDDPQAVLQSAADCDASDISIPVLVGKIYDAAPTSERCRILDHLIGPIGALGLVGVCNGIFTKIWFRSGWHNFHIRPEDVNAVQGVDVISLVDYVQQSSVETIDGLVSLLTTSPMIVYSAATAMLVTLLVRRAKASRIDSGDAGNPPDSPSLPT